MGEPPRRPTIPRLPIAREENVAPPREEKLLTAKPIARTQTTVGMPAPPPEPTKGDRESHDDIEQLTQIERLERERAQLLAQLQDSKQENRLLRETTPTVVFPPVSIPPSASVPVIRSEPVDIKAIEKAISGGRLGKAAIGLGVLVALGWNAFNSVRSAPDKVEAVQARVTQSEQERGQKLVQEALERQRTLAALRAMQCWGQQVRGALRRQGIDLTSLPPGGVTALRLDQGDPSKAPAFVVEEKCPDFPKLPPEQVGQSP